MRIGIDLGGTKVEAIALSDHGETLFRERVPTPKHDYDAIVKAICGLVKRAEAEVGTDNHTPASVGVGIPGSISKQTRLVKNANTQCLIGNPLEDDLSKALSRPVRCSNDANCLAVSEAIDGAAAGYGFVLALILGTGFGSGIAINGQVHNGQNLVAGEVGHIPLPWMTAEELEIAPDCYCGQKGCNETWISGTGFEQDYKRLSGTSLKGPDIMTLVAEDDPIATQTLTRYEDRLARAIASFVNIMDPDIIVLAGGMSNVDQLYDSIPPKLPSYVFGGECETPVVKAKHGDSSGVRGAAWLWPALK